MQPQPHAESKLRPKSKKPSTPPRRPTKGSVLWALVPLLSAGIFSCVPFFARAVMTKRRADRCVAAVYLGATVLMGVSVAIGGPTRSTDSVVNAFSAIGGLLAILLAGVGSVHAWLTYRAPTAAPAWAAAAAPTADPSAHALAAARNAAKHREEARKILQTDPVLARDLRIGRPDLAREYDDGGLVDVNHAPADTIARALSWSLDDAKKIVAARTQTGGFSSAAELSAYSTLDPYKIDAVADLMVFCRG
ncbi:MAG TPA: helix-hairpin-helix domain-containing protein [Actinocrinis sp.]|nr:helix-hairpin-helix domain-containing protein [Actinocrinis sp.]